MPNPPVKTERNEFEILLANLRATIGKGQEPYVNCDNWTDDHVWNNWVGSRHAGTVYRWKMYHRGKGLPMPWFLDECEPPRATVPSSGMALWEDKK